MKGKVSVKSGNLLKGSQESLGAKGAVISALDSSRSKTYLSSAEMSLNLFSPPVHVEKK